MKALVTGGGGFIWSRLVRRLLERGHHVRVLDVQMGRLRHVDNPRLEFAALGSGHLHGAMLDRNLVSRAVKGSDVVYHLAINWDGASWHGTISQPDLFNVNIRGTWNLLEAAKSFGVKQFLFSSSIAVYGKRTTPVVDEDTVCRPELWKGGLGPSYAIVKLAIERLCLMYHYEYGLPVTVFRIDVVFDDEEYQDLEPRTIQRTKHGGIISVAKGEGGACVHVDDVARAFLLATLRRESFGQVFNISNPETYISDLDVCQTVVKSLGSKSEIRLSSPPALTGPRIESIRRAERILDWKPLKTRRDLKKTIARMVREF